MQILLAGFGRKGLALTHDRTLAKVVLFSFRWFLLLDSIGKRSDPSMGK
jgi:hypothetical protein